MKITCHSCQSKYTIADDKVVGKVVKIRCKKCAAAIVLNGTDGSSDAAPPPSSADSRVESWTVNVNETDQRSMTKAEVVEAFRAGTIDAETFCWKDGMGEWLALRRIETLYEACVGPGKIGAAPRAQAKRHEIESHLGVEPAPASFGTTAAQGAASARLAGGRAPTADLFEGFARAGGEDDVPAGPPPKMPDADDAHALTGARNETSVLFSLSALTGTPSTPPSTTEASGLIDIRQLGARISSDDDGKKSRIEDIMNLSGGGAFSPTLVAPVLTAPILDDYSADAVAGDANASRAQKRAGLVGKAVGAGIAVVAVAAGTAIYLMADHGSSSATQTSRASAVMAVPVPGASQKPPPAVAEVGNPNEPAAPPATVDHEEPARSPPTTAPAETKPESTNSAALSKEAMAPTPRATPKAAAPFEAAPFNLAEARTRLSAAASGASACKKSGGPTGTGHVVIVFAPSGSPQSVSVTGAPFSGTPTAACVAARFRAVRVPSFGGSPFSVSKSFSIN
jgi:predicted Zn finger-like uncharacterized protein